MFWKTLQRIPLEFPQKFLENPTRKSPKNFRMKLLEEFKKIKNEFAKNSLKKPPEEFSHKFLEKKTQEFLKQFPPKIPWEILIIFWWNFLNNEEVLEDILAKVSHGMERIWWDGWRKCLSRRGHTDESRFRQTHEMWVHLPEEN